MKKILLRTTVLFLLTMSLMNVNFAKAEVKNTNVTATKEYIFDVTDSILKGKTTQKTYIASKYVYMIFYSKSYKENSYIARYQIPNSGNKLVYKDKMELKRFGHGQTLEYYEYNGKSYFLVATKGIELESDGFYWAKQIGRIAYVANGSIDYVNVPRLSSINRANKLGTSFGSLLRTDAALSSDKKTLLVWGMMEGTNKNQQFTRYDFNKINKKLDSLQNSYYISCEDSAIRAAWKHTFTATKSNLPNGSMQGLELTDENSTYIIGGGIGVTPKIYKYNSSGSIVSKVTLSNKAFVTGESECEGVQLKGNKVYFLDADRTNNTTRCIYSIPKSKF